MGAPKWVGFIQNITPQSLSRDKRIKMEQNKQDANVFGSTTACYDDGEVS